MSGANRQRPRKRDATAADRNALCRALEAACIVRLVIYADKNWLPEMPRKHLGSTPRRSAAARGKQ